MAPDPSILTSATFGNAMGPSTCPPHLSPSLEYSTYCIGLSHPVADDGVAAVVEGPLSQLFFRPSKTTTTAASTSIDNTRSSHRHCQCTVLRLVRARYDAHHKHQPLQTTACPGRESGILSADIPNAADV